THTAVTALQGLATGPQSQDQLAARVGVRPPSMGAVLARLDASGFITRVRDPRNGRKIQAALTHAGNAALEQARLIQHSLQQVSPHPGTLRDELLAIIATSTPPAAATTAKQHHDLPEPPAP
ncbi:MAG TPA: MarR family transcriptional regulator, partial [Arthrobacter sp.]